MTGQKVGSEVNEKVCHTKHLKDERGGLKTMMERHRHLDREEWGKGV